MLLLPPHASTSTIPRAEERFKITCEEPGTSFHMEWEAELVQGSSPPPRLQKKPSSSSAQVFSAQIDVWDERSFLKLNAQQEKILSYHAANPKGNNY